jgi:hypothetical protein
MALVAPVPAWAQQAKVSVDDLRAPSTPAFALLGIEPAAVQRPETPRALATTILSLAGDDKALARNFAIEIAPYWLRSRPTFAFDDFYHGKGRSVISTIATTAKRSFAVSVATTPRLAGNVSAGTSVAIGARLMLWPGRPSALLDSLRARAPRKFGDCSRLTAIDDIDACQKAFTDSLRDNVQPVGFTLQVAMGASGGFPNDTFELGRLRRSGVWISPSYRFPRQFELIGVMRWMHDRLDPGEVASATSFDAGARLRWRASTVVALSAEGVRRRGSGGTHASQTSSRFGGVVEFRASDSWFVFYSLGKDFAAAKAPHSRLLSIIGVSAGFGSKAVVDVK